MSVILQGSFGANKFKDGYIIPGKWVLSLENFRDLMQSDLFRVGFFDSFKFECFLATENG